ncbi:hypothetical protein [Corynebacterium aurimucosum]|uniref:hypothetical protein n=1 Tax=Corynebacterium aurimucosum TaxID=169292 RepID=UPI003990DDE6
MTQPRYEYSFGTPAEQFEDAVRRAFATDQSLQDQNVESITFFAIWKKDNGHQYTNIGEVKDAAPFDRVIRYHDAHELIHQRLLFNIFPPNFAGELHSPYESRTSAMAKSIGATLLAVRYDKAFDSFTYSRRDYNEDHEVPNAFDFFVSIAEKLKDRCQTNAQSSVRSYPTIDHAIPPEAYSNGSDGASAELFHKLIDDIKLDLQLLSHAIDSSWDGIVVSFVVLGTPAGGVLRKVDAVLCWKDGSFQVAPIARNAVEEAAVALVKESSYDQKYDLAVLRMQYIHGEGFSLRIEWNAEAYPYVASPLTASTFVRRVWPFEQ